ncbi:DNA gyrase inhibitor YacG [Rhodobacteraceae bacterium]|nr:DNA gyrase inhibitor YacG [Paracoccaceae bacterium]
MSCPVCKKPTLLDYRPFCSKRCADVDLGRWFAGAYAIPAEDQSPEGTDGLDDDDPTDTRH